MSGPLIASIGTTHPWNIAGVGLDARIGVELGVRVLTVVAAVSAQDADGLHALHAVAAPVLRAELEALPWKDVTAIRVGALACEESVHEVAAALRRVPQILAVVDPVVSASLGGTFADGSTLRALREYLASLPNVVLTPNRHEASLLLGGAAITRANLVESASTLRAMGAYAVLLKGGHLEGDPVDVLAGPDGVETFYQERLRREMRGTGCALAMSLACGIGRGAALLDALRDARTFVRAKIAGARSFQGLYVAY